jgi:polyphosphate kinase
MTEFGPSHFLNRELSWLQFNRRVLEEVQDHHNPLLERVKFLAIFSANLDEFFEVRAAGVKQQIESGALECGMDGLTADEAFQAITRKVRQLLTLLYRCWHRDLVPSLARQGVRFLDFAQMNPADLTWVHGYYQAEVRPVLTPLAIDRAHPFPQLLNKSLNLIVELEAAPIYEKRRQLAIVQVPRVLPPLIQLPHPAAYRDYLFLGTLIGHYLNDLFVGARIIGYWLFRVTRNSELYIDEEESANLLMAVENELHKRRRGDAVRLEVEKDCPPNIQSELLANLLLGPEDLYLIDGPLNPSRLLSLYEGDPRPELRNPTFLPVASPAFQESSDCFAAIRKQDVLLHHPYESFEAVVEFLEQAAADSQVLAIKQTLYRTGGDPRIVGALIKAANHGKQVTAVVELKARFDEANNIEWSRRLEEAGVHVVYGLLGYKIHGKICLVVRREELGIRRYVHLSTGNYNPTTARIYTDVGLFTCDANFGEDATNLFNILTGISQFRGMSELLVAPFELHERILSLIGRETENARQGLPARIIAKMNSLVGREIIEALYRASQAGVQIDLIVRGICCLRPQVKGISENITVRSIVDRFLEHSRIFYFEHACQHEIYVGSADWMPRNFFRRVEVVFPIKSGLLRDRLREQILGITLADNVKARFLQANGSYRRAPAMKGLASVRSQNEFIKTANSQKPGGDQRLAGKKRDLKVRLARSPHRSSRRGP